MATLTGVWLSQFFKVGLLREGKDMTTTQERTKHVLHITDETGDTRIMWDPAVRDEVDTAKAAFKKAKEKGMLAYAVDPDSGAKTGEVIKTFDETKGKIIMVRQTAGG